MTQTPLHRVEGLGSAHSGLTHFWRERVTALALIPLSVWLVASALGLVGATEAEVAGFLQRPWNAVFMGLFVVLTCIHMSLGVQSVIDDYIESEGQKIALLLVNRAFAWLVAAVSLVALARIVI